MDKKSRKIVEKALDYLFETEPDDRQDILAACEKIDVSDSFRKRLNKVFDEELEHVAQMNAGESLGELFKSFGEDYKL